MKSFNTFLEVAFGGDVTSGRHAPLRCGIVGLVTLCFAGSAAALDPTRAVPQYLHESWGADRGLPGASLASIAQTSDGYIWIGTDKGLVRFDGLNFRNFARAYPEPIPIGPVRTLVVDASDNLWILLQNTQVFRYHDGVFEPIRGWTEGGTTAMARGRSGAVLLSTSATGIFTYIENRFRSLSSAASGGAAASVTNNETPGARATPFSWFDRLASPTSLAVSMVQTDDGNIWLATESRGLFYLRDGRVSGVSNGRIAPKITCFLPFKNSELWVGTASGMQRWNGHELTSAGVPASVLNLDVLSLLRDRDSNIWIGTSRGLFRYNANGVSSLNTDESTGPVTALFEDREGNMWLGGARGLERLRDSAFATYSLPDMKSPGTGPLYVDSVGRVWIAPIQGGLRWLEGERSGAVAVDAVANDAVYSIAGADDGDVWLGRREGGLTHLRYSGNSVKAKTYTHADGLVQNSVYAVYKSHDGAIWAGTLNAGVSKWSGGRFSNYTTDDGLASNSVSSIAEGPDGTMWFGTSNGLSALTKTGWRTYTVRDGLVSQDINCLLQDRNDVLWIGTAEGLTFLSQGRLTAPKTIPDSLHEPVFGIAEDRGGSLWISTAGHVLQVKRSSLLAGKLGEADVREYGPADGLPGTEGVKRSVSISSDQSGRVWLSTNSGLSVINPARVAASSVSALVHLEAVLADNRPLDLRNSIRIPAASQRITFRYVGLSLSNSERVRYRYRLDGFDRRWSEPIPNRDVSFTNLNSGPYTFHLLASNSDGLWNSSELTLPFTVDPVFWQTWWFGLTSIFLTGFAVLALIRLRLHAFARQMNMQFEARLAERTRIARDLHDTLLQSFQGLMFRLQAIDSLLPEGRAKEQLEQTLQRADEAIVEGRSAVYDLRSSATLTNDLAKAVTALGEELANPHAAAFRLIVQGAPRDLQPIMRDEVYRIAREGLRNAFAHSHARHIETEIDYGDRALHLRIRDDGEGIPAAMLNGGRPGHYGLAGMRERAKQTGGKLEIRTEAGTGTEIKFSVAALIAYESPGGRGLSRLFRKNRGDQ